ncbi:DUF3598 family protein [Aphanothece sacrum]|uniref:Uncharacterized protein n=1 Tax=Aphanothece sacrum FPU1 TaxID=1920663 RepID=A0A401IES7_APHSA|nr:DUF3598 family protein [Aphanothece sacrum]GBF79768.1 hypothetical protein AsFPU1_1167 [Aphanothece sacrum FPU1]GBF84780.1 hypothetical protein AsFPU3_1834 [Aphanothece sacrum FPU3]
MIENNWKNFLKNLGEWKGSFTVISTQGNIISSTPSIINLEGLEDNKLVRFRVRRFGPGGYDQTPAQDYQQEYRTMGKQLIFFETGTFSKGSLQLAPFSDFGAEFGFIKDDRRLRSVLLFDTQGEFSSITLIREFRSGTDAQERPQLTLDQLLGKWEGIACTASPDFRPLQSCQTSLEVKKIDDTHIQQQLTFENQTITSIARIEDNKLHFEQGEIPRQILLLADGASTNVPLKLKLRQPFFLEVGWLVNTKERQRLIRHYDATGAWTASTHVIEHKVD